LTVENARRNATNTVIVKICASLNPASRGACTSAALACRSRLKRPVIVAG